MKLVIGLIAVLALTVAVTAGNAEAANIYWMNASGGNWNNASNWNTGTVPTVGDNVFINIPGTYTVTLDMNPTLGSLTIGYTSGTQTLRCTSWEITANSTVTVNAGGVLELNSSNLNTGGTYILNNYGTVDIEQSGIGHKVNNYGTLNVARTCSFGQSFYNDTLATMVVEGNSSGSAVLTVDTGFTNCGTISLTSSYPVTSTTAQIVLTSGYLVNTATGTITGDLGASFNNTSVRTISAPVQNAGTINAVSAGLTISMWGDTVTNTGTMIGEGASLGIGLSGGCLFTNTGTMTTYEGGTIGASNGEFVFDSGTLNNAGSLNFSGCTVTFTPKLTNAGRIKLSGSTTIAISDTLINNGTIEQTGGTFNGPAAIENNDSLVYSTGTVNAPVVNNGVIRANISVTFSDSLITGVGSQIVSEATTLNDCYVSFDKGFVNNGTITLTQAAQRNSALSLFSEDTLINAATGVIEALHGEGATAGTRYVDAQIRNEGDINCVDANLYLMGELRKKTNNGTITVSGATLNVQGDFEHSGTIDVASGYGFWHDNHHFTVTGGSFTGDGEIHLQDDTLAITGSLSNGTELWILGGANSITGSLANSGTLTLYSAPFDGGGTITNTGRADVYSSTLTPGFDNQGVLTTTATCSFNGPTTNGIGDSLIVAGNWVGSATLNIDSTFSNYGTVVLTSDTASSTTTATLDVTGGQLNNSGTIVADLGSGTGGTRTLAAELHNTGTLTVDGVALDIAKMSADHVNDGTINVTSGALSFTQSGTTPSLTNNGAIVFSNLMTMTVTGGSFSNAYGGSLEGTGSLNIYATTFTNEGIVSPGLSPGKINLQANDFPMGTNSRMYLEIGGPTPITEYDKVYCTQNIDFGGELHLSLINDYIPAVGDSFRVVDYTSYTGMFTGILGLTYNGVIFDTSFTDSCLWLVVDSIDNTAPIWAAVPDTVTFDSMDSLFIGVWNYAYDPDQEDSTLDYSFSVSNDTLTYTFANGFLLLKSSDPDFSADVDLIMSVTDMHGASAVDTIVVAVTTTPNTAPVIAGLWDSLSFVADSSINLGIWGYVTDAETEDSLLDYSFSVSNDSLVLAYDTSNGILNISSIVGYDGTAWMYLTVTDPKGLQAEDSTKFVVTWNWAPTITGLPDSLSLYADSTKSLNIWSYVSDAETSAGGLTYDFVVSNDSLVASYNAGAGLLTISADVAFAGDVSLIMTVTDPGGKSALDTIVVSVDAPLNHPPEITGFPDSLSFPADTTVMLNVWSYVSDFEDADNQLSYNFSVTNDTLTASFDAGTGILSLYAADSNYYGSVDLMMTVTDQAGDSALDTIAIIVTQVLWPDLPPQIVGLPDTISIHTDSTYSFNIWDYAQDNETPDSALTYQFFVSGGTGLSYGFTQATGAVILDPDPSTSGTRYFHVIVKDTALSEVRDTIVVNIFNDNTAPVLAGLPDTVTFRTDSTTTLDIYGAVTDAETDDTLLTYFFQVGNDSLVTAFDSTTGILTLSVPTDFVGSTWVRIGVIDPGPMADYDTVQVVVTDIPNTPPVFTNLPDTISFNNDTSRTIMLYDYLSDAESPCTDLICSLGRSNLSLNYSFSSINGELVLSADIAYSGVCYLYFEVTDPGGLKAYDTLEITVMSPMGIDDNHDGLPDRFALGQNFPNPFNPTTMVSFMLPEKSTVELTVYNVLGQFVTTLASGEYGPGEHQVTWKADTDQGRPVTSGVYFYRLVVEGKYVETRKMLLLR